VTNLTGTPDDEVLLASVLNQKGMTITYRNAAGSESNRLRIAVAVYDTKPEGTVESDNGKISSPADWNAGASETLISKEKKQTMAGNETEATSQLTLTGEKTWWDYAGKWLKIALRTTSDSAISSSWSDEDGAGESVNYQWIQIPKAQLDAVELKEATTPVARAFNNGYWELAEATQQYAVTRTLKFALSDEAEGYRIQLIGNDQSVHWIYVTKQTDETTKEVTYLVSYAGTTQEPEAKENETSPENSYTSFVGTLKQGENLELPYGQSNFALAEAGMTTTPASFNAYLALDAAGTGMTLALPDVTGYSVDAGATITDTGINYLATQQVMVQAMVYEETNVLETYLDSQIETWQCDATGKTKLTTWEGLGEAPAPEEKQYTVTQQPDTNTCQIALNQPNWIVQKLVTGTDGTLQRVSYMQTDENGNLVLENSDFSYMDNGTEIKQQVWLRFMAVTEDGVSQWSDTYEIKANGTLQKVAEELEVQAELFSIEQAMEGTTEATTQAATVSPTTEVATEAETTQEDTTETETTEETTEINTETNTQENTGEETTEATTEQNSSEAASTTEEAQPDTTETDTTADR
jgi:hypothetical protein